MRLLRAMLVGWPQRLASIPFQIFGLVMVPIAYLFRDEDLDYLKIAHPWVIPWVNPEDWTGGWLNHQPGDNCVPKFLRERYKGFWGFYRYHALRNRAHGLRNYDWHNLRLIEGAIGFETPYYLPYYQHWYLKKWGKAVNGNRFWYYAWQGNHYAFKYIRYFMWRGELRFYECKFGWRITPKDVVYGYDDNSIRWKHGTTATFQPVKFGRYTDD